jgi:hypothetical protein
MNRITLLKYLAVVPATPVAGSLTMTSVKIG